MIAIMGATGNIGSKLAAHLLEKGEKVRVIARSADKLKELENKGAKVFAGDAANVEFLTAAFTGADVVFALIPPNMAAENMRAFYNSFGEKIAEAIRKSGVKNVLNLSSHGAELSEGTGPIKGLHDQEERLNKINGVNVLHLRPTYFMENTLMFAGMIKNMGVIGSAIKGDAKMAMIATKDIAKVAAEEISKRNFSGVKVRELYGQRNVTMNEVAEIFGNKIGKPELKYTQFPYDVAEKGFRQFGISEDVAKQYIEMSKAFNEGMIKMQPRNSDNTTETSIEEFSNIFAAVYNSQ
ncbi:MAG: NmrA family NAD(P)-binding protein [Bacteroidota bacterium]